MESLTSALQYCSDVFVGRELVLLLSLSKHFNQSVKSHPFLRLVFNDSVVIDQLQTLSRSYAIEKLELEKTKNQYQDQISYLDVQIAGFKNMKSKKKSVQSVLKRIRLEKINLNFFLDLTNNHLKASSEYFHFSCNTILDPFEKYYTFEHDLQKQYGIKLSKLPCIEFEYNEGSDYDLLSDIGHRTNPQLFDLFRSYIPQLTNWKSMNEEESQQLISFGSEDMKQVKTALDNNLIVACAKPNRAIFIRINLLVLKFEGLTEKFEAKLLPLTGKEMIQSLLPCTNESVKYVTFEMDLAITDNSMKQQAEHINLLMKHEALIIQSDDCIMLVFKTL